MKIDLCTINGTRIWVDTNAPLLRQYMAAPVKFPRAVEEFSTLERAMLSAHECTDYVRRPRPFVDAAEIGKRAAELKKRYSLEEKLNG